MRDDSKLHIGRLSRISLSEYSFKDGSLVSAAFNMLWGKARFFVARLNKGSKFKVKTRTAVLGVRGTEFLVVVPIPDGITDPTAMKLPPGLLAEITKVVGIDGMVTGVSTRGESVEIISGVTVWFSLDGRLMFNFSYDPNEHSIPKPAPEPDPDVPDIPDSANIRVHQPVQPNVIIPGRVNRLTPGF